MEITYLIFEILASITKNDFCFAVYSIIQLCLFLMMLPLWEEYKKTIITIIIYNLYILATSLFLNNTNEIQIAIETIIFSIIIVYNEVKYGINFSRI